MDFKKNAQNTNTYTFSESQKSAMRSVLSERLGLNKTAKNRLIQNFEQTGTLSGFGAGSLLTFSHLEKNPPEKTEPRIFKSSLLEQFPNIDLENIYCLTPASLENFENDFVCQDIHYRGTKESPGITIGMNEVNGSITNGKTLDTDCKALSLNTDQAANFFTLYMNEFANREFPPNMPIYKFDFKDVLLENGDHKPALVCVADKDSHLYAGHLNMEERAAIIATSMGPTHDPTSGEKKPKGMITDMDYLRTTIDSMIEEDVIVPDRFIGLYSMAIALRHNADPETIAKLESHEKEAAHKDIIDYKDEHAPKATFNLDPKASSVIELHHS